MSNNNNGGNYPSTTGNPSGGGRGNKSCVNEKLDVFVGMLRVLRGGAARQREGEANLIDNARVIYGFEPSAKTHRALLITEQIA